MKDDETQPEINVVMSHEEKEPLQSGQHRLKDWKTIKIKSKEQAEAERLFFLFFPEASQWKVPKILVPFNPTTYFPEFKQEALAILGTGIIGEDGLKGHKKTYHINQRDLFIALLDKDFQYRDVIYFPQVIIKKFDYHFDRMVEFASLAGITPKKIEDIRKRLQSWRDKIIEAVSEGKFPSNWRELIKGESLTSISYKPKSQAQAFAIIFLQFPTKASDKEIAEWTNICLKSLGRPTASESKLRTFIGKERARRPWLLQHHSKNPL
jgi:hypothetical protein